MNAPLVERLNLPMVGVHRMVRLASQIVLGAELAHLRESLGYAGGGSWQAFREETLAGKRLPWTDFTKSEAGITETAARNFSDIGEEVKARVKEAALPGSKELLALMERVPSELTDQERQGMLYEIIRLGLNDEETQTDLRRAHRRRPARSEPRKPEAPQQQDDEYLLGQNMESLALGAGMSQRTARLVRLVLQAKAFKDDAKRLKKSSRNQGHE